MKLSETEVWNRDSEQRRHAY